MSQIKITCNSCGANVVIDGKSAKCPFCGNIAVRPKPKSQSNESANIEELDVYFLDPNITEVQFDELFKNNVIDKDPDKIIDGNNTELISLTFIRFNGSYVGSFTCLSGSERVNYIRRSNGETSWNERVVDIEYVPFQAQLRGEYVVDVCIDKEMFDNLLDEPNDTIQFMQRSTKTQPLRKVEVDDIADEFSVDSHRVIESIEVGIDRINDRTLFPNRGYPLLDETVWEAAYNLAPEPSKDISPTFDYSIDDAKAFVALFYLRTYKHKDVSGLFVVDAGDGTVWGEVEAPGFFELTGRAISSIFGSVKRLFSQSVENVAAVPGLMAVLASKATTSKSISNNTYSEKNSSGLLSQNQTEPDKKILTLQEIERQYLSGMITKKQFSEARFRVLTNNTELRQIKTAQTIEQSEGTSNKKVGSIIERNNNTQTVKNTVLDTINSIDSKEKKGSLNNDEAHKERTKIFGSIISSSNNSSSSQSHAKSKKACVKCGCHAIHTMVVCPNCGCKDFAIIE